jgi:hypothetical protein
VNGILTVPTHNGDVWNNYSEYDRIIFSLERDDCVEIDQNYSARNQFGRAICYCRELHSFFTGKIKNTRDQAVLEFNNLVNSYPPVNNK